MRIHHAISSVILQTSGVCLVCVILIIQKMVVASWIILCNVLMLGGEKKVSVTQVLLLMSLILCYVCWFVQNLYISDILSCPSRSHAEVVSW